MNPEERPNKLRKLESNHDDAQILRETHLPVLEEALSAVSKPVKDSTNESPASAVEHNDNKVDSQVQETNDEPTTTEPISKNQLKKLRRKQVWEAGREFRKAKRKEKLKAKKVRNRAEREERSQTIQKNGEIDQGPRTRKPRPRRPAKLPVAIVIDCGFDNLMVEKERISLGSQLTRSYSDTHRAQFQPHLYVSSWNGLLKERFETVLTGNYRNWRDMIFTDQDFVAAAGQANIIMRSQNRGKWVAAFEKYANASNAEKISEDQQNSQAAAAAAIEPSLSSPEANEKPASTESNHSDKLPVSSQDSLDNIIYLTSESPYTLTSLEPYHTYIVGGLVDKNRHKGICYKTARERGIRTAKLPISEYMEMTSRFVLATNHVVEIMLKWLECGDWAEAFMKVMPKRKGGRLKSTANSIGDGEHLPTEEQGDYVDESEHGDTFVSDDVDESDTVDDVEKRGEDDEDDNNSNQEV